MNLRSKSNAQVFPNHDKCDWCGKPMTGVQYRFKVQGKYYWVNNCCHQKMIKKTEEQQ